MKPAASLFHADQFTLHSGGSSPFKIDCDALSDADVCAVATWLRSILPLFGEIEGVPQGGMRLADALRSHRTAGPLLIVDDVLTTGASMETQRAGREAIGAVIFARGPCPLWITPLFTLQSEVALDPGGWQPNIADAQQQLKYWWEETGRCPCGARRETPATHPHVSACPTEAAIEALTRPVRS